MTVKKTISFLCLFFLCLFGNAQHTTKGDTKKDNLIDVKEKKSKILVIPFEPKLYLSEIDKKLGAENKLNFYQLRDIFRDGLDARVEAYMKNLTSAYSLMNDSAKNSADLALVYKSISYKYTPVLSNGIADSKASASKTDSKSKVKNGELVVEMKYDQRFMNTNIINPKLLPYLNQKYGAEIFVFITQLDIKNNLASDYDINSGGYEREVSVHYTIFNLEGKQISAGLAVSKLPASQNDPRKIINTSFSTIGRIISQTISHLFVPAKDNAKPQAPDKVH